MTPPGKPAPGDFVTAAKNKDKARMLTLLHQGADVNEKSEFGNTALIWSAANGWVEEVRQLLAAGAHIDDKNVYGESALGRAVGCGHAAVVRVLLDAGADFRIVTVTGRTPLADARTHGYADIAAMLEAEPAARTARKQEYLKARMSHLNIRKGPQP